MNKVIIILIIILIVLYLSTQENFYPFAYGRINPPTYSRYAPPKTYVDMSAGSLNYPSAFKLGEIDWDNRPYRNYDEYVNKLHNRHMEEPISRYNNSCPCQKLEN